MGQNLVEYRVIQLPPVTADVVQGADRLERALHDVCHTMKNEPIELRGASLTVFDVLVAVRASRVATELIWRKDASAPAYLLQTLLDETETIRPSFVAAGWVWDEQEHEDMERRRASDTRRDITLDLARLWHRHSSRDGQEQHKACLTEVYAIEPRKDRIALSGEVPLSFAFPVWQWFAGRAETVTYDHMKIVN